MLAEDDDRMRRDVIPRGVRLLPPHDPYTQMRDRETIVPKELHREIWKTVGDPGALLIDGRIAGTWRARKRNRRLGLRPVRTESGRLVPCVIRSASSAMQHCRGTNGSCPNARSAQFTCGHRLSRAPNRRVHRPECGRGLRGGIAPGSRCGCRVHAAGPLSRCRRLPPPHRARR